MASAENFASTVSRDANYQSNSHYTRSSRVIDLPDGLSCRDAHRNALRRTCFPMNEPERPANYPDPRTSTTDPKGIPYSVRIRRARESAGLSPTEICEKIGVSEFTYRDWEWGDGDISNSASLTELARLASALRIRTSEIFDDNPAIHQQFSTIELVDKVNAHLKANGLDIAALEDRVGFDLSSAIQSPSEVLKWNLDCLRFVCSEIGVDWRQALPAEAGC